MVRAFKNSQGSGGDVWNFGNCGGPNSWSPPEIWEDFGSTTRTQLILTNDPSLQFGEWYIYTVTIGPDQGEVVMRGYINGALKGTARALPLAGMQRPRIGDFGNSASIINVAEILLYDRILSGAEMSEVGSYLSKKFGVDYSTDSRVAQSTLSKDYERLLEKRGYDMLPVSQRSESGNPKSVRQIDLGGEWELAEAPAEISLGLDNVDKLDWTRVKMPASIHQALYKAGKADSLWFGDGWEKALGLADRDWYLRRHFRVPMRQGRQIRRGLTGPNIVVDGSTASLSPRMLLWTYS